MILCDLQPIPYLPVKFTCNGIHSRGEFLYPPYPYLIPIFYLFSVPILLFLTTSPSDSLCTCTWLLPSCPLSSSQLPSPLSPLTHTFSLSLSSAFSFTCHFLSPFSPFSLCFFARRPTARRPASSSAGAAAAARCVLMTGGYAHRSGQRNDYCAVKRSSKTIREFSSFPLRESCWGGCGGVCV